MQAEEFTLVKGRSKKTHKKTTILAECNDRTEIDIKQSIVRIKQASNDLLISTFFEKLKTDLKTYEKCETIWCFGLGHIGECVTARYQFALLLLIKDVLDIPPCKIYVNDPIFYKEEISIIEECKINVVLENLECRLQCSERSFIFLPHCPKQMTNNLLFSNWSPNLLSNLVIFCNSFCNTMERNTRENIERNGFLIMTAIDEHIVKEIPVHNIFKFDDIFNDCSLHTFFNLDALDKGFWEVEEPKYPEEETEFIRKSLS